jgi:hypothetical protein
MKLRIRGNSICWRVAQSGLARIATDGHAEDGILVERDFECLAPRSGEDVADLFVNPLKSGAANH